VLLSTVWGITLQAAPLLAGDEEVDQRCVVLGCRLYGDPKTQDKKINEDRYGQDGVFEVPLRLHQRARVGQLLASELCLDSIDLRFHDFTLA
jgi:hypothetical protein